MYPEFAYENTRRVGYEIEGEGTAYFLPVCPNCGRYVKMDDTIEYGNGMLGNKPNATCKKCGRVKIPCELID